MRSTKGFRAVCLVNILTIYFVAFALLGCAPTEIRQKAKLYQPEEGISVLLMPVDIELSAMRFDGVQQVKGHKPREVVSVLLLPVDIELSALTTGGVTEVRADWTETAKRLVSDALERELAEKSDRLLTYLEPEDKLTLQRHQQITRLISVIGETIMIYSLMPVVEPPTKKKVFDWSIGSEVTSLYKTSGADYGLFIYIRDSYATGGRKALMTTAALFGIGLTGGAQVGFATLVDLRDGSVVWFNRIVNHTGDLRTRGPAADTVKELIEGIPL